ncbi:hypothetical protein EV1_034260 [Malus domestica]
MDPSPSQTIHALTCAWDASSAATFVDTIGSLSSHSILDWMTLWSSPPPNPMIKINVDASWKIGSSVAWVGLVVRVAGVVIESDSKNVITYLNDCSMSYAWEIFLIPSRIRVVRKTFQSCS